MQEKGEGSRFNSGKWLKISRDFKEIRTGSEQMTLPAWSIQEGKGNLEVRFRWLGGHKSISSGTKDEREANNRAPGLVSKWIRAHGKENQAHPLEELAAAFVAEQYADRKKDTRDEVDLILRRLAVAFPSIPSLDQLTPQAFRKGLARYRGTAAPGYWTNILVTTRKFCRWAVKLGYMAEDPTEGIPSGGKGKGKRRDVWAEGYFEDVCEAVTDKDREILLIMRWSGMDSGDVAGFDPNVHIVKAEDGTPTIRKRREKAKGDEETMVQPLSSKLGFLIGRKEGYGAGYASVRSFTASLRKRVQSSMERADLPVRDLKSLRHTFATYHAERGVPLDVLRGWLGHARDSRTLDRYYLHRASTSRFMD